uniref:Uncharacterized protein n=1 Tax=Arundo donax TaxID=35708 RepID=A0A0A8ZFG0_ARUDO
MGAPVKVDPVDPGRQALVPQI